MGYVDQEMLTARQSAYVKLRNVVSWRLQWSRHWFLTVVGENPWLLSARKCDSTLQGLRFREKTHVLTWVKPISWAQSILDSLVF